MIRTDPGRWDPSNFVAPIVTRADSLTAPMTAARMWSWSATFELFPSPVATRLDDAEVHLLRQRLSLRRSPSCAHRRHERAVFCEGGPQLHGHLADHRTGRPGHRENTHSTPSPNFDKVNDDRRQPGAIGIRSARHGVDGRTF